MLKGNLPVNRPVVSRTKLPPANQYISYYIIIKSYTRYTREL